MDSSLWILSGTAIFIAFLHTVIGPDHYLPFIMLGRANNWSSKKVAVISALCGVGHVVSSVILGAIGIIAGIAIRNLELFESYRGEIASYLLIGFGLAYAVWGLRRAYRNRPHSHFHLGADAPEKGVVHQAPGLKIRGEDQELVEGDGELLTGVQAEEVLAVLQRDNPAVQ